MLREGLAGLLAERGFDVVAAVGDAEALLAAVDADPPDVTVVDIRMPPTHTDEGLRAAIELRQRHPAVAVLVFSQYIETRYAAELLADRSDGVGLPAEGPGGPRQRVRRRPAAGGGRRHRPRPRGGEPAHGRQPAHRRAGRADAPRGEVLALMAEGRSNAAIAAALVVTPRAVEKHVGNIFMKLDLPESDTDHRRVLAVLRWLRS